MFGWWGYVTLPFLSFYYELSFYAIYLHFTSDCYPCRFYFFYFLPYVYLSMLKISVVLKRGIFKDWKKKSSGFKCRNLFPILYSREYVASLDQFGGDILISFIYLFLAYTGLTTGFYFDSEFFLFINPYSIVLNFYWKVVLIRGFLQTWLGLLR